MTKWSEETKQWSFVKISTPSNFIEAFHKFPGSWREITEHPFYGKASEVKIIAIEKRFRTIKGEIVIEPTSFEVVPNLINSFGKKFPRTRYELQGFLIKYLPQNHDRLGGLFPEPKVLHLTLKKEWFYLISSGQKREEYREIKPYWEKRLRLSEPPDEITFRNGYGANRPTIRVKCRGITIGKGRPEWGAPADQEVYIIHLGNIIKS